MAHGSNEVNVSGPSAAMIFMLDLNKFCITEKEEAIGMTIGLASLLVGFMTLGKRYLHKYRKQFMSVSLSK
jgi:phosphate/sulfate permease